MWFKKVIFAAFIVLSVQANAMDLWGVYSFALRHDAGLQLAQQNFLIDEQTALEGKSLLRPIVTASARLGKSFYKSDAPDLGNVFSNLDACIDPTSCLSDLLSRAQSLSGGTNTQFTATDLGVSVTQPIYDKARWHQYQKIQIISQRGAIALKQAHANLVYRTAEAYLTALQAFDSLKQGKAEHSELRRQLKYAQKQLQQGLGRASDLYELSSADQLKSSQAQILRSGLKAALSELSGLTGKVVSAKDIKRLEVKIPVEELKPKGQQAWIDLANKHNLEIRNAQLEMRLAAEEYKLKKSARHPKVNFLANYNKTSTSGGQGFVPAAETKLLGVDLSVPLYQGGSITAGQKKAQYQHAATKQNLRQQQNRLVVTVDALYAQIEGNIRAFNILSDSLEKAKRAEKNLAKGASQAVVSVSEILRAKQKTINIRSQVEALRFEYLLNKLKLRQIVGVLSVKDIKAINSLLMP